MKFQIYKAEERGAADYGWLKAKYSFSFANYHNPSKVHFGMLRVLNDDIIAPGMGFGMHPHDNMEIITIPLKGSLEHKDSMGNIGVIKPNEIQAMSAGSGLMHSEYNHSKSEEVCVLQIWIFPKEKNITPRYDQRVFSEEEKTDKFKTIVAPEKAQDVMWINQDAYFSLGKFKRDTTTSYSIKRKENGAYVFLIEGEIKIQNQILRKRDAIGIWDTEKFDIEISNDAEILIIDVPMN